MADHHPTARRLYKVVDALRGIRGQSNVARLLNISPQTMRNWEVRGISVEGAVAAEATLGIPAHWLLTGNTVPGGADPLAQDAPRLRGPFATGEELAPYNTRTVRQTLEDLAVQLAGSDLAARGSAAPLLAKLAESPEMAPRLIRALEALLADVQPSTSTR